jgi:hypothetical protein
VVLAAASINPEKNKTNPIWRSTQEMAYGSAAALGDQRRIGVPNEPNAR